MKKPPFSETGAKAPAELLAQVDWAIRHPPSAIRKAADGGLSPIAPNNTTTKSLTSPYVFALTSATFMLKNECAAGFFPFLSGRSELGDA